MSLETMPEGGAGAESARGQTIPTPQQKKAAQAVSEVLKTGMARSKVQNNSLSVYVCGERWPAFFEGGGDLSLGPGALINLAG